MENNCEALRLLKLFSKTIEERENKFSGHAENVANTTLKMISLFPQLKRQNVLAEYAALLHDIGKIKIPENILNKNVPLNLDEQEKIKNHSCYGKSILDDVSKDIPFFCMLGKIIKVHHKRYDELNKDELKGKEEEVIYIISQLIALSETYDVMLYGRINDEKSEVEIKDELMDNTGKQFDTQLALLFVHFCC